MLCPMRLKSKAANTLRCSIHDVGIPQTLHNNNAKELMQGKWRKVCNDYSINTTYTEPHSPWQNRAEGSIRETKHHIHRKMKAHNVPKRLWAYCAKWSCDVRNKTSSSIYIQWRVELPMKLYMGIHPTFHLSVNLISMNQYGIMSIMPFLRTRELWEGG